MKTTCITLFFLYITALAQPPYFPFGPQTNVSKASLHGWTECWSGSYVDGGYISAILSPCQGDYLLLACGPTGDNTLTLLAAGSRSAITFNTGISNNPINNNGVGWYYGDNWSWGFAKEGDLILRYPCDILDSSIANGTNGDARLCWNTYGE